MGGPELNKLFNICADHWESCRVERRCYVPGMSEFFEEAIAQADPAACVEDQFKLVANPNWGWRALRILSQKSLHFFTSTNQPAKSLPNYLDTMVVCVPNIYKFFVFRAVFRICKYISCSQVPDQSR